MYHPSRGFLNESFPFLFSAMSNLGRICAICNDATADHCDKIERDNPKKTLFLRQLVTVALVIIDSSKWIKSEFDCLGRKFIHEVSSRLSIFQPSINHSFKLANTSKVDMGLSIGFTKDMYNCNGSMEVIRTTLLCYKSQR